MQIPDKPAATDSPILKDIRERWSPVAFSDQPVEDDKIRTMFEAARWAPSSFNEQPWRYIYALKADGEARTTLENLLSPGNAWAKNAGILAITFTKKTFARNGKDNIHAMHDLGAASGYLALQLGALGLVGHQMAGFDRENANKILGVPDDFMPGSMIAIGYPADPASLPEDLQKRQAGPRSRKPQEEFVFRGRWTAV
jgi:nitroreductase